MNKTIQSLTRTAILSLAKRKFHVSNIKHAAKEESVQETNPYCLEAIQYSSHTLRKHDNPRRQRIYEFGLYVAACLPKYIQKIQMQHTDQLEILVAPEGIFQVLSFLCHHQHACFNVCSAATAVDVPSREFRFEVVYCLLSIRFCERITVKTYTDELTPLESAFPLWKTMKWFEREIYDMFGVVFSHHPDLRRILTDYGFDGHPLRKDFPLVGYQEVRYDDEQKRIVYEPLEFSQEMRNYQLKSPWTYYNEFHEGYNKQPKKPKSE